jgi:predicted permease
VSQKEARDRTVRVFRALLLLYPLEYRQRYAREMEGFFLEERGVTGGGLRFWIRLVADHVEAAWAVRRLARRKGSGSMGRGAEDLRSAARALLRAPAFTAFAVGTLALGIGATTSVFSVLDRILLRPLPYPASERMVRVGIEARVAPEDLNPLSTRLMERYQDAPGPAEEVVAAGALTVVLADRGDPERLRTALVTRGFFDFFGARPAVGRLLDDGDYAADAPKAVVLGHELWTSRYGADSGVVGESIRLDDEVHAIVGVLSRDFIPPPDVAGGDGLWVPLSVRGEGPYEGAFFLAGVARLRPGGSPEELDAYADQVTAELYPSDDGPSFLVGAKTVSYRDEVVGPMSSVLSRVMGAVAILLLIACVNVASLLLTRGAQRVHELTVRAALGAGWTRLVRQLLAESVLVALAGGLLGSGLAWGAVEAFRRLAPAGLPRLEEVSLDGRGLAFGLMLGLVTVLLFGLLPALRAARSAATVSDRLSRRATAGRHEGRLRAGLVATETALAVVLAVASALMARDLYRIASEDPGFRPEGVVAMELDIRNRYEEEEWLAVWDRLLEGARGLPGVTAAGLASQAPYAGTRLASTFRPEGREDEDAEFLVEVRVAGEYVQALGAELREGRSFTEDDDGSTPVALVNQTLVERFWPGEPGVGKVLHSGRTDLGEPSYDIVGVLSDVRAQVGRGVTPTVYLPLAETPRPGMEILVRTDGEAVTLAPGLRELVRRVDPGLAVSRISTVEGLARDGLVRPRFYALLFGGFALVALLLAVVGVYGTTAYATRSRVREIGIRLALGARRARVVRGVVGRTALTVGLGVLVGLAGASLAARAMVDVLVHVTPRDVAAYAMVAFLVLTTGVVAAWIPAGRAGRIDPATTLREEG